MEKKPAQIVSEMFDLLEPLATEERHRILSSVLALLGENLIANKTDGKSGGGESLMETSDGLPQKAKIWAKQNAVSSDQLEQVFHIGEDGVEIIASTLPGKGNSERCVKAYLLTGIAKLLATGDASFSDDDARDFCTKAGCYDSTNHSKFYKSMGNSFSGTKAKGWVLTGPGLKSGAALVKELAVAP